MDDTVGRNWINITAKDLALLLQRRNSGEVTFFLLDVRNPNEQEICIIPNTDKLIPVKELSSRINELPNKNKTMVVYCKSGIRSETACQILLEQGYKSIYHLKEGILSYAREVDSEMAEY